MGHICDFDNSNGRFAIEQGWAQELERYGLTVVIRLFVGRHGAAGALRGAAVPMPSSADWSVHCAAAGHLLTQGRGGDVAPDGAGIQRGGENDEDVAPTALLFRWSAVRSMRVRFWRKVRGQDRMRNRAGDKSPAGRAATSRRTPEEGAAGPGGVPASSRPLEKADGWGRSRGGFPAGGNQEPGRAERDSPAGCIDLPGAGR